MDVLRFIRQIWTERTRVPEEQAPAVASLGWPDAQVTGAGSSFPPGSFMIQTVVAPVPSPLTSEALAALRERSVRVNRIDQTMVSSPGLYAIYGARDIWVELDLGEPTDDRPLYVGKAEATLASRDIDVHFGRRKDGAQSPTGSSTLRRSISALLADQHDYRGIPRNPDNPGYFANFGLSPGDDDQLSAWMEVNLRLAVWPHEDADDLDTIETQVLGELLPPLNLNKVDTPWRRQIKDARKLLADEARAWDPSRNK